MSWEAELEVLRSAAARAGDLALRYRRRGFVVDAKADRSPVTSADRACERLIAGLLEEAFPDDGLLGEEGARKPSRSGRRWIIDPIDGTRDFVRGGPAWAILIGLEAGDDTAAGVCFLPLLGDMYFASRGNGAWRNADRIQASPIADLSRAVLCLTGFDNLARQSFAPRLLPWAARFWTVRNFGGALDAMLVASGKAEAWIEPSVKAWDLAPLKVIVEEAGGRFFNFDGSSSIHGGNAVACSPGIEEEIRRFLDPFANP